MAFAPDLRGLLRIMTIGVLDSKDIEPAERFCYGVTKTGNRCSNHLSAQQIALSALRVKFIALLDLINIAVYEELVHLAKSLLCGKHKKDKKQTDLFVSSWLKQYEKGTCEEWSIKQGLDRQRFGLRALLEADEDINLKQDETASLNSVDGEGQSSAWKTHGDDEPVASRLDQSNPTRSSFQELNCFDRSTKTQSRIDASSTKPSQKSMECVPRTPLNTTRRLGAECSGLIKEPSEVPHTLSSTSNSIKFEDEDSPHSQDSGFWTDRSSHSVISTPGTSPPSRSIDKSTELQPASPESPTARRASRIGTRVTRANSLAAAKRPPSAHKGLSNASLEFEDFSDPRKTPKDLFELMLDAVQRPVTPQDCEGYIYMLQRESSPGFIKIGRSTHPDARIEEHRGRCKYKPTRIRDDESTSVRYHKKLEYLVHKELQYYRRSERACTGCLKRHVEWFEVDSDVARATIKRWRDWMLTHPYGDDGNLKDFWQSHLSTLAYREGITYDQGADWQRWIDSLPAQSKAKIQPDSEKSAVTHPVVLKGRRRSFGAIDVTLQNITMAASIDDCQGSLGVPTSRARSKSLNRLEPSNDRNVAARVQAEQVSKTLIPASSPASRGRRLSEIKPEDVQNMLTQPASAAANLILSESGSCDRDLKGSEVEKSENEKSDGEECGVENSNEEEHQAEEDKKLVPRLPLRMIRMKQNQNLVRRTVNRNIANISAEPIQGTVEDSLKQSEGPSIDPIKEPLATGGLGNIIKTSKAVKGAGIKAAVG
ncbi:MAG: hypothetical protein M1836_003905 [Candelina mexicana]|nr:MAG: hypothetical protein M1836_003905 [Candelina mexicana]